MVYVLKNYEPQELILFNPYFRVSYHQRDGIVPHINTFVYIGKNLYPEAHEDNQDYYYFQDADSFEKYGMCLELSEDIEHFTIYLRSDALASMESIDRLIEHLIYIKSQINTLNKKTGEGNEFGGHHT